MKIFLSRYMYALIPGLFLACSTQNTTLSNVPIHAENVQTQLSKKNIYHLTLENKYLEYIIVGKKIAEGRLNLPEFAGAKKGDLIYFTDSEGNWALCTILSVNRFDSFDKMLVSEGVINMLPQIDPSTNTFLEMVIKGDEIYSSFPGYKKGVKIYGSIAFGLHYDRDGEKPLDHEMVSVQHEPKRPI